MRRFGKATQEGTFLRFFREAQKTLIHYKQAPGFFTALPDPFQKSGRDKLPGRIVRVTEEDQIRLRGNSVQNGFRECKILFLLTVDAADPASGQSEGMLVLRKSRNRNQSRSRSSRRIRTRKLLILKRRLQSCKSSILQRIYLTKSRSQMMIYSKHL